MNNPSQPARCGIQSNVRFVHQSRLAAPPETVFAFHEREDALRLLIPPWQKVEILSRTGGLEAGARVELRLRFGPFSITWLAVHTACVRHQFFVDEQQNGPFAYWRHRHDFLPDDGGCILRDTVDCRLPFGLTPLFGWLLARDLRRMFQYRHAATARALGLN